MILKLAILFLFYFKIHCKIKLIKTKEPISSLSLWPNTNKYRRAYFSAQMLPKLYVVSGSPFVP